MKVAIVGSRSFMNATAVDTVVARLVERDPEVIIVSGGARGVDTLAETAARKLCKNPPVVVPADWDRYGKGAGPRRNQQLIEMVDQVVALWDGTSRGTADALRRAVLRGIPVFIYHTEQRRWLTEEEAQAAVKATM